MVHSVRSCLVAPRSPEPSTCRHLSAEDTTQSLRPMHYRYLAQRRAHITAVLVNAAAMSGASASRGLAGPGSGPGYHRRQPVPNIITEAAAPLARRTSPALPSPLAELGGGARDCGGSSPSPAAAASPPVAEPPQQQAPAPPAGLQDPSALRTAAPPPLRRYRWRHLTDSGSDTPEAARSAASGGTSCPDSTPSVNGAATSAPAAGAAASSMRGGRGGPSQMSTTALLSSPATPALASSASRGGSHQGGGPYPDTGGLDSGRAPRTRPRTRHVGRGCTGPSPARDQPAGGSSCQPQPQPQPRRRSSRAPTASQLTVSLTSSPSLQHLLARLDQLGALRPAAPSASAGVSAAGAVGRPPSTAGGARRQALNAVQLCAAMTTAERLASSGGPVPRGPHLGLLSPPCRPLSSRDSSALNALLAAHSEVLADSQPQEMAATLWAAARMRLRLPAAVLEPTLEAVWMWDPADPTANRHPAASGSGGEGPDAAGGGGGRPRGWCRDVMGPREVCLLLYAVSVLRPGYLRRNAGGFVEALDSYEAEAAGRRGSPGGGGGGRTGGGGLAAEQVVGVVAALARADAWLDEEGQEFVLQAVSSRLASFSTPQLTSLLAASQTWPPLGAPLHDRLLGSLLQRLAEEQRRYLELKRQTREQQQQERQQKQQERQQQQEQQQERQQKGESKRPAGRQQDAGAAGAVATAADEHDMVLRPVAVPPTAAAAVAASAGSTARALVTALRSCLHPGTGEMRVHGSVVSGLLRQVRHRAAALNPRDVCEGLRLLADLRRHRAGVAAWNEGLRALLGRWTALLLLEAEAEEEEAEGEAKEKAEEAEEEEPRAAAALARGGQEGVRGRSNGTVWERTRGQQSRKGPAAAAGAAVLSVPAVDAKALEEGGASAEAEEVEGPDITARSAAARTFAASLHAVSRLGLRLQPEEAGAAAVAAAALAPHMARLADCCMVLTALAGGAVGPGTGEDCAGAGGDRGGPQRQQREGEGLRQGQGHGSTAQASAAQEALGWQWLDGSGMERMGPRGRRAARLVLERAAVHLRRHGEGYGHMGRRPGPSGPSAGPIPGELACMVRAAAALGAWPPDRWWRTWEAGARGALPNSVQLPSGPGAGGNPEPSAGRVQGAAGRVQGAAVAFSAAEATDVLHSLAQLVHLRSRGAAAEAPVRRRRLRCRGTGGRSAGPDATGAVPAGDETGAQGGSSWGAQAAASASGAAAAATAATTAAPAAAPTAATTTTTAPVGREVLRALLAVACWRGGLQPQRRAPFAAAAVAAGGPRSGPSAGRRNEGRSGRRDPMDPGPMTTYQLAWAVARLRLLSPREVALWGPRLEAAAPRALPLLTPRKQVLMLRSLHRAFRGAALPLPPEVAEAWLASFQASMGRARAATLSYAAAAMSEAQLSAPSGWLAGFRAAVRSQAADLGLREVAALVAGLRLHRRQPQQQEQQEQQEQPVQYDGGNAGLARMLLLGLRRKLSASAVPEPGMPTTAALAAQPSKPRRGSQSRIHSAPQMNEAERLVARRLCALLARGAAAAGDEQSGRRAPAPLPPAAGMSPRLLPAAGAADLVAPSVVVLAPRPLLNIRAVEREGRPLRLSQRPQQVPTRR